MVSKSPGFLVFELAQWKIRELARFFRGAFFELDQKSLISTVFDLDQNRASSNDPPYFDLAQELAQNRASSKSSSILEILYLVSWLLGI